MRLGVTLRSFLARSAIKQKFWSQNCRSKTSELCAINSALPSMYLHRFFDLLQYYSYDENGLMILWQIITIWGLKFENGMIKTTTSHFLVVFCHSYHLHHQCSSKPQLYVCTVVYRSDSPIRKLWSVRSLRQNKPQQASCFLVFLHCGILKCFEDVHVITEHNFHAYI